MLISIIIPTYNAADYIVMAIDSILNQTYKNYEIIVIDDGSLDNTRLVLEPFIKNGDIRYFFKENGGEASARNFGLSKVNGDYIAFLDADDLYKEDKLEKQIKIFELNSDIDVIYNDVILIDEDNNEIGSLKSEEIIDNPQNFFAQILYRQVIPASASMMIRRKCIDENVRYSENYSNAVDYSFIIRLAEKFKFYYLQEELYYYRRHSGNLTNNHLKQVQCEKNIVKTLGIPKIRQIVSETAYSNTEKTFLLAKIFIKINEYELALIELNKIESSEWEYYFIKSVIYYKLSDYKNAIKYLLKSNVIEIRAESFNNLGCSYYHLGDKQKAIKYLKKAKSIKKTYNDPINNLLAIKSNRSVKITERRLRKCLTDYNAK